VLGDLIDLAQDNSVQWPEPRKLAPSPLPHRRHYLRVTGEPHPGLQRRIESLVRRAGLSVLAHASRGEGDAIHHAVLISPSDDAPMAGLLEQLAQLGRVDQTLWLGVVE
jgi:hypothetical protein